MSASEWRLIGLQVVTGLVVAFVRHALQTHRMWDSFGQFLVSWVIHTVAVIVLMAIALVPILWFHKFFLGYEYEGTKKKSEELSFYLLMTVLVASVCIFLVAHNVPMDDLDDY
jgi:hypothetical protein